MTLDEITALVGTCKKVRVKGPQSDYTGVVALVKSLPPPDSSISHAFPGARGIGLDTEDGRKFMIMFPDPLITWTVVTD